MWRAVAAGCKAFIDLGRASSHISATVKTPWGSTMTRRSTALLCSSALFGLLTQTGLAADDHPGFSGVWQAIASDAGAGRNVAAVPLSEAGKAMVAAALAPYPNLVEQGAYCVPPGMPSSMTAMVSYPVEILQSEGRITMLVELESQYRRIWMDGREHPLDSWLPTRMGHSVGRWEGDTLVIETKMLSEDFFGRIPRTENTTITERVSMMPRSELTATPSTYINNATIDDNILAFQITVEDPVLYTTPYTVTIYYQHIDDYAMLEYDCVQQIWRDALEAANP